MKNGLDNGVHLNTSAARSLVLFQTKQGKKGISLRHLLRSHPSRLYLL